MSQYIDATGMREFNFTGIGGGFDVTIPLIYAFIHKNKSRLRIADDFGFGTFLSSNSVVIKDALTDTEIKFDKDKSSRSSVNVGLTFYYGIQAVYRINNMFDIGVKYIPLYATGDENVTNIGKTYGLHARIKSFYIDYRTTPTASYTRSKNADNTFESNGAKYVSIKYLLPNTRNNKYFFASLNSYSYQKNDPYGNGGTFIPAGYENFESGKNRSNIFRIGMGLMLF